MVRKLKPFLCVPFSGHLGHRQLAAAGGAVAAVVPLGSAASGGAAVAGAEAAVWAGVRGMKQPHVWQRQQWFHSASQQLAALLWPALKPLYGPVLGA